MSRFLFVNILAGLVAAVIANQKGRNWAFWGLASAFLPFLVIPLLFLPSVLAAGRTKKCPFCAEVIKQEASVCKHCHREQPVEMRRCPSCGKFVPDKAYCSECHRSLRS